jgi:hypothetical protein
MIATRFLMSTIVLVAACGNDRDRQDTQPAARAEVPSSTASVATSAAGGVASSRVDAVVADHAVQAPTTIGAGTVEFAVKNTGSSQHEFVVIKGSYADLPKTGNGAVLEDQLAAGALVGRTSRITEGASETKSFTLTAGKYVLLCNIVNGPTSHAGIGQRLDVTVV